MGPSCATETALLFPWYRRSGTNWVHARCHFSSPGPCQPPYDIFIFANLALCTKPRPAFSFSPLLYQNLSLLSQDVSGLYQRHDVLNPIYIDIPKFWSRIWVCQRRIWYIMSLVQAGDVLGQNWQVLVQPWGERERLVWVGYI